VHDLEISVPVHTIKLDIFVKTRKDVLLLLQIVDKLVGHDFKDLGLADVQSSPVFFPPLVHSHVAVEIFEPLVSSHDRYLALSLEKSKGCVKKLLLHLHPSIVGSSLIINWAKFKVIRH